MISSSTVLSQGHTTTTILKITRLVPTGQSHTKIKEAFDVKYEHVAAIAVWNINCKTVAYWLLYTRSGEWLGRVTHLRYIEEANEIYRNSGTRKGL